LKKLFRKQGGEQKKKRKTHEIGTSPEGKGAVSGKGLKNGAKVETPIQKSDLYYWAKKGGGASPDSGKEGVGPKCNPEQKKREKSRKRGSESRRNNNNRRKRKAALPNHN